ncbi:MULTISPECIES: hypothetical protein [Paraburkholderia]|uniref:hypothetical protein n=1 Tax=Paraburkholderia TaxID=1822464 RepID=UPI0022597D2C|nr:MULTISPECIES: hypothetical protein [Paraburkholderia]MCX4154986.1 hypothetical protein [Paraburkholderia aspalathi]MDN7164396.1 hypothetical protein [Paraburkholderia sp. SECH2]MDQ6392881.1 hypothetical protein [Paraburkholderia aspalathi]
MGGGGPNIPTPTPPPPPPTYDDAAAKAQQNAAGLANRRGMASTILAGQNQNTSAVQPAVRTAASSLLGA